MSLSAQITSTGISAPSYADIYAALQTSVQTIYGSDVYIEPDSQDGQFLAIFASAINDANQLAISVYNAFSPATAQGTGLSSVVKINGLRRLVSSNSTAPVLIVGQAGTVVTNGVIGDVNGNRWDLPATVDIPLSGQITVTATAEALGAITATAGTITSILTPTRGWQTVSNTSDAAAGAPVEIDATLRRRQSVSTALPAQTVIAGIVGTVANLAGVQRYAIYENDTSTTDSNGIPDHSISLVVEGGDVMAIAAAIAQKKTQGTGTYGTTTETVIDQAGVPNTINFFVLQNVSIYMAFVLHPLPGYVSSTGTAIVAAAALWANSLDIGQDVYLNKIWGVANLSGDIAMASSGLTQVQLDKLSSTYNVTSIMIGLSPGALGTSDLSIAFNQAAESAVGNITLATA